jgi:hypothetical protein
MRPSPGATALAIDQNADSSARLTSLARRQTPARRSCCSSRAYSCHPYADPYNSWLLVELGRPDGRIVPAQRTCVHLVARSDMIYTISEPPRDAARCRVQRPVRPKRKQRSPRDRRVPNSDADNSPTFAIVRTGHRPGRAVRRRSSSTAVIREFGRQRGRHRSRDSATRSPVDCHSGLLPTRRARVTGRAAAQPECVNAFAGRRKMSATSS